MREDDGRTKGGHADTPRVRVKMVIPTASRRRRRGVPVHSRDSDGRARQCWHRRRRLMTCGYFPPAMHACRPSFGLQEPSFPPSVFPWRYSSLGVLSTTRNDPLTAGTFHSVPRGKKAVMPSLSNRIIYGRRRSSGIYHPSSSSFLRLAGSDVFDLTGVALSGRALFPSPLFPLYGGWKAIKPTPTMPHHSSAYPSSF